MVRSTLSLTFVIALARVVFNVKGRMTREATWELELKGRPDEAASRGGG